jgi:methionine-S-sulfoxide reductase
MRWIPTSEEASETRPKAGERAHDLFSAFSTLPHPAALCHPRRMINSVQHETATLAGGCFWGMEEILRQIPGVIETSVGYTGGDASDPNYKQVCTGTTGHAEAIRILFDPAVLPYAGLLDAFFRMHDPTTPNRQHNDIGTQYRSAIFHHSPAQQRAAGEAIARWNASGQFPRPIVTQIEPAAHFWRAEEYHQKYLVKNPGGYNCHILRPA